MKKLFLKIFLLTFFFLTFSCGEEKNETIPSNVMSPKKLSKLLSDLHLIDAASKQRIINDERNLTLKYELYKGVLQEKGISKELFDSTLYFYTNHPELLSEIYDSMLVNLQNQRDSIPNN